ncbi:hypothetical protein KFL_001390170 [Klebsormidium nitens]|uniref:RING-type domain-containing protein n=1 Tax=Klebsormidium nitens TaxID=105231 RepID=A0A1Y1HX12_KLENI|nr:hypothetical protein KFL_001390170 [Klebsormidium nitens]|eukprot:GAQ83200.1 hypothetical protein KFL_001390170 [Klebsormidium nitens]
MGKSKFHKSEKAARTLSFFQSNSIAPASSKVTPESSFLQDAVVARQLLSTAVWQGNFDTLIDQLEVLKTGDEARCLAALNKLTSDKALLASVAAVESLTEQLAKELHNLILARSSGKKGKSGATASNRKKTCVSTEASSPVSNGVQPGEKTTTTAASEEPVPVCKKENDKALSAQVDCCPEEEEVDDRMGAPNYFSTAREAPEGSEPEASATKDNPLNKLLETQGCTTADLQKICKQSPVELVSQTVAMPGILVPSPGLRLLGSSKALALISAPESLEIAPIFIASRRRADVAHLNLAVPWMLADKKHVVLLTIEPSDEAAYRKWAEQSERHILVVLPEDGRGIGYARRWIQDVAAHLKLKRYWQMDDNVCAIRDQDEIIPAHRVMELLQGLEPRSLISVVHPSCKLFVWYPMVLLYTPLKSPRFKAVFNERERVADAEWVDFTEQVHAIDGPLIHDKTPCWLVPYQPGYVGGWGVPDVNGESALPFHKYESREEVALGARMWYTRSCFFGSGHFDREAIQKAVPNTVLQAVYALLDVLVTVCHEIWVEGRYHTLVPWPLHPLVEASLKLNGQKWPSRAVYNLLGIFKDLRNVAAKDPALLKWWSEVGWRLLDGSEKWQTKTSSPIVSTKGKAGSQSKAASSSPAKVGAAAAPRSGSRGQKTQTDTDKAERAEPQNGMERTGDNTGKQEQTSAGAEGGFKKEDAEERTDASKAKGVEAQSGAGPGVALKSFEGAVTEVKAPRIARRKGRVGSDVQVATSETPGVGTSTEKEPEQDSVKASPPAESVTVDDSKPVAEEAVLESKELAVSGAVGKPVEHPPGSASGVLSESTIAGAVEACQLSAAATELLLRSTKNVAGLVVTFLEGEGYKMASQNGTQRVTVGDSVSRILFKLSPTATSPALCTLLFLTLSLYAVDVDSDKGLLLQYCKLIASRAGLFESLYLSSFISYVCIAAAANLREVIIQRATIQALSKLVSSATDIDGIHALPAVMGAMAAHPQDVQVQYLGFSFLADLANMACSNRRWMMAVLGAASSATAAMVLGRGNESMQKKGCRLIRILAESLLSKPDSTGTVTDAAKTEQEDRSRKVSAPALVPLHSPDSALKRSRRGTRFIQTFDDIFSAVRKALESSPGSTEQVKKDCLMKLMAYTNSETAELIFSSLSDYASAVLTGQVELPPWREAVSAVFQALKSFPRSRAVQEEGLAALAELLQGPSCRAVCHTFQILRDFSNRESASQCFMLDDLRGVLVRVAVNFPQDLQLLGSSVKLLRQLFEKQIPKFVAYPVTAVSYYQEAPQTKSSPFFVSTYVPTTSHTERLPRLGPKFAPWITSFDGTACSLSAPGHPLWTDSFLEFPESLMTRPLSQYWNQHRAGLKSKKQDRSQPATPPDPPVLFSNLCEAEAYFSSESFAIALQSMQPHCRAMAVEFVKLVKSLVAAIAALEAVAVPPSEAAKDAKNEEVRLAEPFCAELDLVEPACVLLEATENVLFSATNELKIALSSAAAASEKAAGNESARERWQSFVDATEAGRDEQRKARDELREGGKASDEGSPSNDEGQARSEEVETVPGGSQAAVEGPAKEPGSKESREESKESSGEACKAHALSPEEESLLSEQAAALVSSLADLCQLPVALRKAVQALRPLLTTARAAETVALAAYVLSSVYSAWSRLEPALVGEMLIDRPWFAAFVPPRCEKLLAVSWKESGVVELFEILETWGETEEKWTAAPEDARHQVVAAVHAFASLSPTFSTDASELLASGGLPRVLSGVAAALHVMMGEPDQDTQDFCTGAMILLAKNHPRVLTRGFAGAWLEDLESCLAVLRLLTQPAAAADRSWDVVSTFLDVLRTKRSDIHRLVKKLKRGSKQGAKDLRDLIPETPADVPLTLLRLRSEKLWEGGLSGEGRLEELFPLEEVASRLFEAVQKAAVKRAGGEAAGTGGSPEKAVERLQDAAASLTSSTNGGNSQPNQTAAEAPAKLSPRGDNRWTALQPLFDSWAQPVVWDAAFETMVIKCGEEVKGGPPLGLFRTCLLECMDSEALVFARELTQKLADEPSPGRNLRALSQLFAVVGHAARDRPESAAVFIASGLVSEIGITMTRFAPGGEAFSGGEEVEGAEERLGDLQRDGGFALSAILSKAAAERKSGEAGERRVLTQLLESCEDATFEVLQSAYWKYTPAELPEGAAEAGVSTPLERADLGEGGKVRPRKDVRDAARMGLLNLRALLPETSPKFKAISSLCLAHDAIVADQAEAMALVTRADCLQEDGFDRSAAWYCDFWKRDWLLPSDLPSTEIETPSAADLEPSKATATEAESVPFDETTTVPGPESAVEATAEPAEAGGSGGSPPNQSASERGVSSIVSGGGQDADARGSAELSEPQQKEVSQEQALPPDPKQLLIAQVKGFGSAAVRKEARLGEEQKASEAELNEDRQVAAVGPSESSPGGLDPEAQSAGAAGGGDAIAPCKKASKKKKKKKQSRQAAVESKEVQPKPSEGSNVPSQPGTSVDQAENPQSPEAASPSELEAGCSQEAKREESQCLSSGAPREGAEEAAVSSLLKEAASILEQTGAPLSQTAPRSKSVTESAKAMDAVRELVSQLPPAERPLQTALEELMAKVFSFATKCQELKKETVEQFVPAVGASSRATTETQGRAEADGQGELVHRSRFEGTKVKWFEGIRLLLDEGEELLEKLRRFLRDPSWGPKVKSHEVIHLSLNEGEKVLKKLRRFLRTLAEGKGKDPVSLAKALGNYLSGGSLREGEKEPEVTQGSAKGSAKGPEGKKAMAGVEMVFEFEEGASSADDALNIAPFVFGSASESVARAQKERVRKRRTQKGKKGGAEEGEKRSSIRVLRSPGRSMQLAFWAEGKHFAVQLQNGGKEEAGPPLTSCALLEDLTGRKWTLPQNVSSALVTVSSDGGARDGSETYLWEPENARAGRAESVRKVSAEEAEALKGAGDMSSEGQELGSGTGEGAVESEDAASGGRKQPADDEMIEGSAAQKPEKESVGCSDDVAAVAGAFKRSGVEMLQQGVPVSADGEEAGAGKDGRGAQELGRGEEPSVQVEGKNGEALQLGVEGKEAEASWNSEGKETAGAERRGLIGSDEISLLQVTSSSEETGAVPGAELTDGGTGSLRKEFERSDSATAGRLGAISGVMSTLAGSAHQSSSESDVKGVAPEAVEDPLRMSEPAQSTIQSEEDVGEPAEPDEFAVLLGMLKGEGPAAGKSSLLESGASEKLQSKGPLIGEIEKMEKLAEKTLPVPLTEEVVVVAPVFANPMGSALLVEESPGVGGSADVESGGADVAKRDAEKTELGRSVPGGLSGAAESGLDPLEPSREREQTHPGAGVVEVQEGRSELPTGGGEGEKGELGQAAADLPEPVSKEANGGEGITADVLNEGTGEVNGVPETAVETLVEESGKVSGGAETAAKSEEAESGETSRGSETAANVSAVESEEANRGVESTAVILQQGPEEGKRRGGTGSEILEGEPGETTGGPGTAAEVVTPEGEAAESAANRTEAEPEQARAASDTFSDVPDFVSEPDDEAWFDATDEECDEPSPRVAKGRAELSPETDGAEGRTFERGAAGKEAERGEVVKEEVEDTEVGEAQNATGDEVVESANGVASVEVPKAQPDGGMEQKAEPGEVEQNEAEGKTVGLEETAREADDAAKEKVGKDAEKRVEAPKDAEREVEGDERLSAAPLSDLAKAAGSVGGSKATGERKTESEGREGATKEEGETRRAAKGSEVSGGTSEKMVAVPLRGNDETAATGAQDGEGLDGEAGRAADTWAVGASKGVQNGGPDERGGADSDVPDFVSDEESEPEEKPEYAEATSGLPADPKANGTEERTLPAAPKLSRKADALPSAELTAVILPLPRSSSAGILPLPRSASPGVLPRPSSAAGVLERPSPPAIPVPPAPPVPDDLPDFVSSGSEAESSEEENGDTTADTRGLSGRLSRMPAPAVGLLKSLPEKRVKEPIPPGLERPGRTGTVRTGERREQVRFAAEVTSPLEQLRQGTYQPPRVRTSFVAQTLENPASPPLSPPPGPEPPASELEEGDFKPGDDDVSDADSEGWVTLGSEHGGGHDWRLARDLYGTFPYEAGYRSLATSAESSLSPPKRPLRLSQQAAGVAGGGGSAGLERAQAPVGARLGSVQQQKIGPGLNQANINDGCWIDVVPRKKKAQPPLRPGQDVRIMEAQYFSEALPAAPRAHARKKVRGGRKVPHRQAELRHARLMSGAAQLPLPPGIQPHAPRPAALLHPNLGLAAAFPPLPPHPKRAQARPQPPLNSQNPARTKANTGRQYVPANTTWADIPDPSDSATDTGTPLVGRPTHSPLATEEPLGRRRAIPDPKYQFPTERLALQAGLPNEITRQEPPSRVAPRQYAPSLHGPSAKARPAALGGFLGGHVSDSGRAEQPRATRQTAQYFSDVEGAGVDPRVVELICSAADVRALRSQERAAAPSQLIAHPQVPPVGRPPRSPQKQRTDAAQIGRRANEPVMVRAESIISDEGAGRPQKAAKRRQAEEEADDAYCCICFENPKNAALSPCGHLLCVECAGVMHKTRKTCPVCSKKIESVLKLFDSAIRLPAHLR